MDAGTGTATVVGSVIADEAIGHQLGRVLVVVDSADAVCDLELALSADASIDAVLPSSNVQRVDALIATTVKVRVDPVAVREGDWLSIVFADDEGATWHRFADSSVHLAAVERALVAIAVHRPESDPSGEIEAAWIDAFALFRAAADLQQSPLCRG